MDIIAGIDLGTTNSEVALIIDGHVEIISDNDDGILPSCVGLDAENNIIVGAPARNQEILAPDRTVSSIKRLMGSGKTVVLGDTEYRPREISAFILKELKQRAEKQTGGPVNKAVITVPAYFTDHQRQATREAGEIAGLEVVRIINEPTAAALAYERDQPEARRILVYDLGGGTFDVSIVRIEGGVVEVLASAGDNHLGGDDFDAEIVGFLKAHLQEMADLDNLDDPQIAARLFRAAREAKARLSVDTVVAIEEDHIAVKDRKPVHLSAELNREQFTDMIREYLNRTMEAVNQALKDAAMLPSDIDRIILAGGSTRIPAVTEFLEEKFGRAPHGEIDPDTCVAVGAGIQAGREMGLDHAGVLLEITPYSFGTSALKNVDGQISPYCFVPIIRRNSKLPVTRTETFCTVCNQQKAVNIDVYQGESENALENVLIGKYNFDLTPAPRGSFIDLKYHLDINGILRLEAVERESGRKIEAVIENALGGTDESALEAAREKVAAAWGHAGDTVDAGFTGISDEDDAAAEEGAVEPADAASRNADLPPELRTLVKKAEACLADVPEEDREDLVNLLEDIRDAFAQGDDARLAEVRESLEDLLFYLD